MKTVRGLGRGWGVLWASTSLEYFSNDNSIKMRHQIEISTEKISNMRLSFEAQFKTEFNGGKKCSEFPLQMNPAKPYWVGVTLSDPHWYSTKTHWAPNDPPLTHNDPPFRPQPTWITPNYPTIVPKDLDWTNSTNYCEHRKPSSPQKKQPIMTCDPENLTYSSIMRPETF